MISSPSISAGFPGAYAFGETNADWLFCGLTDGLLGDVTFAFQGASPGQVWLMGKRWNSF
jgi:hypothetical protein